MEPLDEIPKGPELTKLKDRLVGLFRLQVIIALVQVLLTASEWGEISEMSMIHGAARAQDIFILYPPLIVGGVIAIAGAVVAAKARATASRSPELRYSNVFRLLTVLTMVQPPAACLVGQHILSTTL